MTNYCKDCEQRELGCHGNCEAYKAYKQWNEERKLEDRAKRMTVHAAGRKADAQVQTTI